MLKNFVIWSGFYALSGIVLTSVITESLNKSTFADCKLNISRDNKACIQVLKTGYDYQKNPYQVFEVGQGQAPWANTDRDPRKLIDKSIREIAAQFAIGRFYTRRI